MANFAILEETLAYIKAHPEQWRPLCSNSTGIVTLTDKELFAIRTWGKNIE